MWKLTPKELSYAESLWLGTATSFDLREFSCLSLPVVYLWDFSLNWKWEKEMGKTAAQQVRFILSGTQKQFSCKTKLLQHGLRQLLLQSSSGRTRPISLTIKRWAKAQHTFIIINNHKYFYRHCISQSLRNIYLGDVCPWLSSHTFHCHRIWSFLVYIIAAMGILSTLSLCKQAEMAGPNIKKI